MLGAILAIAITISEIGTVIVFDIITDKVLAEHRLAGFWPLAAAWLGIAVAAAGVMFAGGYLSALTRERFLLRLRDGVFAHAQWLSLDFFDRKRLGDLMVRLLDDLEVIEGLVCSGLAAAAAAAVSLLLLATAAVVISSSLACSPSLSRRCSGWFPGPSPGASPGRRGRSGRRTARFPPRWKKACPTRRWCRPSIASPIRRCGCTRKARPGYARGWPKPG